MSSIDRREAIRRISVALGASVTAPTIAGIFGECSAPSADGGFVPATLTEGRLRRVELLAEAVIPETDTPGASAARVHEFIDVMLTDFYPADVRAHFLEGLGEVAADARARFGRDDLSDLSENEMDELLMDLDRAAYPDPATDPESAAAVQRTVAEGAPPFMRTLKELVVAGYYTSEIGQTVELRLMPFGDFDADVAYDEVGRSWA